MVDFPAALKDIPAIDWAPAINMRRSARTYAGLPVEGTALAALGEFCSGLPGRPTARVEVAETVPPELFKGVIVGSYGRVVGATSAFVVVGRQDERGVEESMGYLGEAALLQATLMGLGTCWVAGSFDRALASQLVDLEPEERVYAVSPLGYAQERPRAGERLLKAVVQAGHRRPVKEVAPGFDEERWPDWAAEGVRLARLAPSAVNRQPWQFELEPGSVVVSVVERGVEGSISRLLDIGIAMLHFEVGARLLEARGYWELLEPPRAARFRVVPR